MENTENKSMQEKNGAKEEERKPGSKKTLILVSKECARNVKAFGRDLHRMFAGTQYEMYFDSKEHVYNVVEVVENYRCSNSVYIETRKRGVYMWINHGEEKHTIRLELHQTKAAKFIGAREIYVHKTRPLLAFFGNFHTDGFDFFKKTATKLFSVGDDKTVDRIFAFFRIDRYVVFRNYNIYYDEHKKKYMLENAGPEFIAGINKIFDGRYGGDVIHGSYKNKKKHVRESRAKEAQNAEDCTARDMFDANMQKALEGFGEAAEAEINNRLGKRK